MMSDEANKEITSKDVEANLKHISKASRLASIILFLVAGLWLVGSLFSSIVLVVGCLFPENPFATMTGDVFYSVIIALVGLLVFFALTTVGLIFRDIGKGKTPFSYGQVKRLRFVALLLVLYVFVDALQSGNADGLFHVGELNFHVSLTERPLTNINVGMLMGALVCFCMSFVFRYGLLLQSVSDDVV
ncbi:MAG: hypothetical protein J6D25_03970 [Eggerthellaceae bacterium]|nr:hypothetical protein [Eggerthellaceae bacterium]